jgi:hypothetical protein
VNFANPIHRQCALAVCFFLSCAAYAQAPPKPAHTDVHSADVYSTATPARLRERTQLLAQAEGSLQRGDGTAALQTFEQAANITHAADTEMGIIRARMQLGQYQQAMAFAAHTAGAHLDEPSGTALYAWLLYIGGQGVFAQRLLSESLARMPQQPLLLAVQQQLKSGAPLASGALLKPPLRTAPQGSLQGLPAQAAVRGSGWLIDRGQRALVPLALLGTRAPPSATVWLRNGLGQMVAAQLERKLPDLQLAVLKLTKPLPASETLLAPRDAFPGSVAMAVAYLPARDATPRWPLLHVGFLGDAMPNGSSGPARQLGVTMPPSERGGPVFDDGGRLMGLAVHSAKTPDSLVLASQLHKLLGDQLGRMAAAGPHAKIGADGVYQQALRNTLQVITAP